MKKSKKRHPHHRHFAKRAKARYGVKMDQATIQAIIQEIKEQNSKSLPSDGNTNSTHQHLVRGPSGQWFRVVYNRRTSTVKSALPLERQHREMAAKLAGVSVVDFQGRPVSPEREQKILREIEGGIEITDKTGLPAVIAELSYLGRFARVVLSEDRSRIVQVDAPHKPDLAIIKESLGRTQIFPGVFV